MSEIKTRKAARTVIFDENNKIAILEVQNGEYYKIIGGGIEDGETEEQAAKREAFEEAGCDVEIVGKIGEQDFSFSNEKVDKVHYSVCFLAKVIGEKKDTKFDDWEKSNNFKLHWLCFEDAVKLFQSASPEDEFKKEINKRDLEFLKIAYKHKFK